MPKPRSKANQGLPTRWRLIRGAYFYDVPRGLEHRWDGKRLFRLGDNLAEAYGVWGQRIGQDALEVRTIGGLLDRYAREVIPAKAPASQASNRNQLPKLREVFGSMPLLPFTPKLVYQYVDIRSKKKVDPATGLVKGGRVSAHREIELLSHAYTKAVEWGYIDRHPFKGEVRLKGERPRVRYVEDWEIVEALSLTSRRKTGSVLMIQAYLRIKLLTGMAQGDLLRLKPAEHFKDDGIHIQRHKTAHSSSRSTIYEWDDTKDEQGIVVPGQLRQAVQMALDTRPSQKSEFLFCTRTGKGYVNEQVGRASGWKSMWQRFVARVLKETEVKEPFTEHDLRAKVASDAESLEHARALLSHADSRTTHRVYRRKAERVKPLQRK